MITPIMLLLSSINEKFEYDAPIDISYLAKEDREFILSEVDRFGGILCDENRVFFENDYLAADFQLVNGEVVEVSPMTRVILSRLKQAYNVFSTGSYNSAVADELDWGSDILLLRLEGNPHYVYNYIYDIFTTRGISYDEALSKVRDMYSALVTASRMPVESEDKRSIAREERLRLHADESFWISLCLRDIVKTNVCGLTLGHEDFEKMRTELKSMGFYGFVNPYAMYLEFDTSRIQRKVSVKIEDSIFLFLDKVVRAGD